MTGERPNRSDAQRKPRLFERFRRNSQPRRIRGTITSTVFISLLASDVICLAAVLILYVSGMLNALYIAPLVWVVITLLSSSAISAVISMLYTFHFVKPLETLIEATKRVTEGDYSATVQIDPESPIAKSELGQLADSFNCMTRELAGTELFRKDFISNFSHEFKTPIISIRGFARQLMDDDLTPEQRENFARIIFEETELLSGMSSNVLLLTKFEHQQIVSEKTEFLLDEQLRHCMLMFEEQWTALNLNVEMDLEEVRCYSNEEMLSCVWTNLFSNAIKFSKKDGALFVSCHKEEDCVVVRVRDSGIGMSQEMQAHIFEKFYQGDPSHACKGNGLGLALVRRILDLLGGEIAVDSAPNFGSTFIVRLKL